MSLFSIKGDVLNTSISVEHTPENSTTPCLFRYGRNLPYSISPASKTFLVLLIPSALTARITPVSFSIFSNPTYFVSGVNSSIFSLIHQEFHLDVPTSIHLATHTAALPLAQGRRQGVLLVSFLSCSWPCHFSFAARSSSATSCRSLAASRRLAMALSALSTGSGKSS